MPHLGLGITEQMKLEEEGDGLGGEDVQYDA